MARGIDVDEVQFGFGAVAADRVVGGCVDVPAFEVGGLVVVGNAGVRGPVARVRDGESGAVTPVVEVASDGTVVVEFGKVVERKAVA